MLFDFVFVVAAALSLFAGGMLVQRFFEFLTLRYWIWKHPNVSPNNKLVRSRFFEPLLFAESVALEQQPKDSSMMVVYVAGPFRGETPWQVELNVRRAEELALEVAKIGAMPLCPHTMTRHFDKLLTDQFWLDGTLELLKRCDAVVLTARWQLSTGTKAEVESAVKQGKPVFDSVEELAIWFAGIKAEKVARG